MFRRVGSPNRGRRHFPQWPPLYLSPRPGRSSASIFSEDSDAAFRSSPRPVSPIPEHVLQLGTDLTSQIIEAPTSELSHRVHEIQNFRQNLKVLRTVRRSLLLKMCQAFIVEGIFIVTEVTFFSIVYLAEIPSSWSKILTFLELVLTFGLVVSIVKGISCAHSRKSVQEMIEKLKNMIAESEAEIDNPSRENSESGERLVSSISLDLSDAEEVNEDEQDSENNSMWKSAKDCLCKCFERKAIDENLDYKNTSDVWLTVQQTTYLNLSKGNMVTLQICLIFAAASLSEAIKHSTDENTKWVIILYTMAFLFLSYGGHSLAESWSCFLQSEVFAKKTITWCDIHRPLISCEFWKGCVCIFRYIFSLLKFVFCRAPCNIGRFIKDKCTSQRRVSPDAEEPVDITLSNDAAFWLSVQADTCFGQSTGSFMKVIISVITASIFTDFARVVEDETTFVKNTILAFLFFGYAFYSTMESYSTFRQSAVLADVNVPAQWYWRILCWGILQLSVLAELCVSIISSCRRGILWFLEFCALCLIRTFISFRYCVRILD